MSKLSRTKGASFERSVCDIFTHALNPSAPFKRNIGQARDGGNDIDIGPLVVECKIRKTLGTVYGWLGQATEAATVRPHPRSTTQFAPFRRMHRQTWPMIPVVVARQDGDVQPIVILRLEDFLTLTREKLKASL